MIGLMLAFLGLRTNPYTFDRLPDYEALDEIPAEEPILRDLADSLYGMTLGRRGEIDLAAEVTLRCIQRERKPLGRLAIPTLVPFLARIYLMQGRLRATVSLCHEYLDPIKEKGSRFIYSAGSMNIALGEVFYEWNYLEEAEQQIRDGLQANEPWVDIMSDAFGLLALTRILLARRDYPRAMQVVEKFETRLAGNLRPHEFEENFRTLKIRVQLASGDLKNASHWADQVVLSEDFRLHQERYLLTLAWIRFARGRYTEVEALLTGIPFPDKAGNRVTRQIESNLLLAAAIARQAVQRRLPEALGLIEASLALAEPEGYIRIFLDIGAPAQELLAAYLRSAAPGHKVYAQKLLDAFSPSGRAMLLACRPLELIEPLTGREVEVLQLMALGRTNQEIARQLFVAPGTIKAHAASIFRKLDVANRTEAVARARQLGVLP